MELKDYTPNSNRYREQTKQKEVEETADKKEKVTSGKVSTKKQSVGKKITSNLFIGDMAKILDYFIYDVAIPAGKKFIWDAVTSALDISLNGDARRHEYSRDGRSGTRTAYNRAYEDRNGRSSASSGKVATRCGTYDYDEVIFETFGDANLVLDEMWKDLDKFKQVSVADMYDHAGVTSDRFTDNKYGWHNLRGADVGRNTNGTYYLKLPAPEALD